MQGKRQRRHDLIPVDHLPRARPRRSAIRIAVQRQIPISAPCSRYDRAFSASVCGGAEALIDITTVRLATDGNTTSASSSQRICGATL
jgi:hypothetical protein